MLNIHIYDLYIVYIGSSKVSAKIQKDLRKLLENECSRRKECLYINLRTHTSQTNIFDYYSNNNSNSYNNYNNYNDNNHIDVMDPLLPYEKATFCLMPGGDFPTR